MKRLTTEEFIRKARAIHGNKYDYSKVVYINSYTPVIIICPIHGEFLCTPNNHLSNKTGCPYCNGGVRIDTDEFIRRARLVHGDKYGYTKSIYVNSVTPIIITCPIHGDFEQVPAYHLSGNGCPTCGGTKRLTTEEFIIRAGLVHDNKYGYTKSVYINAYTPIIVTCPIHGDFVTLPHYHLLGSGCTMCNGGVKIDTNEFIRRARLVHGDKYGYTKSVYINSSTPIIITCPIHGDFEQVPSTHLSGSGCPICNSSKLESIVRLYLDSNKIEYIEQMKWPWLVYKNPQSIDFYLPQLNIGIECQGSQHFIMSTLFDRNPSTFQERMSKDINKQKLCLLNGVRLYYFSNLSTSTSQFNYPYLVFEDMDLLLEDARRSSLII